MAVEHGDDDNIFEDNQPLLKCPETKEVLREKKSKWDDFLVPHILPVNSREILNSSNHVLFWTC